MDNERKWSLAAKKEKKGDGAQQRRDAQVVRRVQRRVIETRERREKKGSKPDNNDNASDASSYPDVDSSRNKGGGC